MGRRKKSEDKVVNAKSKPAKADDFESLMGEASPDPVPAAPVVNVISTAAVKHLLELNQIREEALRPPVEPVEPPRTPRRGKPLRAVETYKSERPAGANKTLDRTKVPSRLRHLQHTPKFKQG